MFGKLELKDFKSVTVYPELYKVAMNDAGHIVLAHARYSPKNTSKPTAIDMPLDLAIKIANEIITAATIMKSAKELEQSKKEKK